METKRIQTVVSFKTVDRSYVRSEFIEMEKGNTDIVSLSIAITTELYFN